MTVLLNRQNVDENRKRVPGTRVAGGVLLKDRPRLALEFRIGDAGDWVVIINGGQPMIATDVEVELYTQLQAARKKIAHLSKSVESVGG